MAEEINDPDWWDDDQDEMNLPEFCPCCSCEYDEVDYEYQICSLCGYNNNEKSEE